ncbi:RNA polymerase sigma factor [Dactylosporangium sp. NPDC051484]|uniref:RNA polymerase sigma factor n=1 Tax=Dactylosporangium sp. NPDC051484 TaxID=3154942 RepID=UPI00344F45CF
MSESDDLLHPASFESLIRLHGPAVHAYLVRRVGLVVDADDLLAETWLAAYGSRSSFDPAQGTVRGWLFGVARHVLVGHYRQSARRARGLSLRMAKQPSAIDEWAAVDARLDALAYGPQLRAALFGLPPVEREAILLVAWEQLTPEEISQALAIPAATVRTRLYRARHRLRERLVGLGPVTGVHDGEASSTRRNR